MARTIVLLANQQDLHADAIANVCAKYGMDVLRFAPSQLVGDAPDLSLTIDGSRGTWSISSHGRTVTSQDSYGVLCRDWELQSMPSTDQLERSVAIEETAAFLHAWAHMLKRESCIEHPFVQREFENKLLQIPLAKAAGLRIPATIAGNDPDTIRDFLKSRTGVIKLLSHVSFIGMEGQGEFVYTSRITEEHHAFLDEVRICPVLVQELIEKVADVRATVVCDEIFSAIVWPIASTSSSIDTRACRNEPAQRFELPPEVCQAIRRLVRIMGVRFAALDLGLTAAGDIIFFEANVTGNWLWIEQEAGLPITEAIVQALDAI